MGIMGKIKKKGGIPMKNNEKKLIAKALTAVTNSVLSVAANSRCAMIYHQPKQPDALRRFRKF